MNNFSKFATAINCIDGRIQQTVADWIKLHTYVQYVNMITEPGVDGVFSYGSQSIIDAISEKLQLSVRVHQPKIIAFVGHFDCLANPVSFEEHIEQIKYGVDLIYSWNLGVRIIGLYVNEWNSIDLICDTDSEYKEIKSYL